MRPAYSSIASLTHGSRLLPTHNILSFMGRQPHPRIRFRAESTAARRSRRRPSPGLWPPSPRGRGEMNPLSLWERDRVRDTSTRATTKQHRYPLEGESVSKIRFLAGRLDLRRQLQFRRHAPEAVQVIIFADLVMKDMHQHITVIHDDPFAVVGALDIVDLAVLLQSGTDVFGNGLVLFVGRTGDNHHVVGNRRDP